MAYIGKSPSIGSYSMLDNLTASATASYSLTLDSVAFVPESANHLIVSLNGVIQKAGSSFTVSGSTLTFSSALTSSDSIDFCLALGSVLDIGTPSDATVTNAKTNFVSTSSAAGLSIKGDGTTDGTLQLNCSQNSHGIKLKSPAHSASQSYTLTFPTTSPSADKFLKTDGSGNLSFADAGGAIDHFSRWDAGVLTHGGSASTLMTSWTQVHSSSDVLGHSSGTFSYPSTGHYLIQANCSMSIYPGADARNLSLQIYTTSDNASYSAAHSSQTHIRDVGDATHAGASFTFMEDVTNTTNQKFRIYAYSATTPSNTLQFTSTVMTVVRVGDT